MSNASEYLSGLFGPAAAPSPEPAVALDRLASEFPADVLAACRVATVRWEHGDGPQPEALDAGGWPVGAIEPEPCPTCPRLLTWQDVGGRWRCEACDADALARSQRLADAAARSRQRWPAGTAPRTAPGRGPAALSDSQHLDSRRPSERTPGGFAGVET